MSARTGDDGGGGGSGSGVLDWTMAYNWGNAAASSSPLDNVSSSSGVMQPGGGHGHGGGGGDDSHLKRQVRLIKNREAAKECRRKKKEYVKCLENRIAVLENQNKALIEELKALKELYYRKEKTTEQRPY